MQQRHTHSAVGHLHWKLLGQATKGLSIWFSLCFLNVLVRISNVKNPGIFDMISPDHRGYVQNDGTFP